MRAAERGALGSLPPPSRGGGGRSGPDAPDRRTASGTAVLRLAADNVSTQRGRPRRQSQAGAAADARDGDRGAGSSSRHEPGRAGTQDLSLPPARRGDHRTEPCVGVRHHLYSDGERPSLSGGDHRLGEPCSAGLAAFEYDGHAFLPRRAGRSPGATRKASDIQYRSRRAVHQRRIHSKARSRRNRDFDGRTRPFHGQHLDRTLVALARQPSGSPSARTTPYAPSTATGIKITPYKARHATRAFWYPRRPASRETHVWIEGC